MATIVTRAGKGSPLTFNEVDANFTNLNDGKLETTGGTLTGPVTITSGTQTVSTPALNMTQTWNNAATTFTGYKLNVTDTASNASSLLMDLQVGGVSKFNVNRGGVVTVGGFATGNSSGIFVNGNNVNSLIGYNAQQSVFYFSPNNNPLAYNVGSGFLYANQIRIGGGISTSNWAADFPVILTRKALASLQLGAAAAAAPVAQTLGVQSVVAGTTNTAGANFTIAGSQGTGTGTGGNIVFQVAPAGSTGTAQNVLVPALAIDSTQTYSFGAASSVATTLRFGGPNYFLTATRGASSLDFGVGDDRLRIDAFPAIIMAGRGFYGWTNGNITNTATTDLFLTRKAAASLRLGYADAAAPIAQTFGVQSVVAGTTNTAGQTFTIAGSQGTGTGAGGSIVFQVAPAGLTGSGQNALSTALTIGSDRNLTLWGNGSAYYFESASGFEYFGSGTIAVRAAGARAQAWKVTGQGQSVMASAALFGWASGAAESTSIDTILARDAANTLAQRNGVNAQTKRLYGTYTDASNYRRLAMTMSAAGVSEIKPEGAGTGASGNVLHISGLPTSNPGPGILWNNAGTPAIGT